MTKKKIISGVIIAIIIVAVVYYFFFRSNTAAIAAMPAADPADQAAYDNLYNLLSGVDSTAVNGWLGDIARDYYSGARVEFDQGRLVNGKVTKTGALLSAWATSYYPNSTLSNKDQVNGQAYAIFSNYQRSTGNKL